MPKSATKSKQPDPSVQTSFSICPLCDEPILENDKKSSFMNPLAHWECGMRGVLGGVNHMIGRCTCCGGTEPPDPPGLSRRQAAREAVKQWERMRHETN